MMDRRIARAQRLHWEIEALLRLGVHGAGLRAKRREAAALHEELACERIAQDDLLGWTDLFAAITYWAEAGHSLHAFELLQFGTHIAIGAVVSELEALRTWMTEIAVIPTLGEFATALPALPEAVAA